MTDGRDPPDDRNAADGPDAAEDAEPETLPPSTRLSVGVERFRERLRPLARTLGAGVRRSRLADVGRRLRTGVARSRLVQWLTREPDPDVIVIDLTETRTLGPILAALDRLAEALATPLASSSLGRTATRAAEATKRHAVPAASGALLGLVIGTLALTWEGANPLWLAALAIAGVAGLLGLTVDRSRAALRDSTVARWMAGVLVPPEGEEPSTRRSADERTR